MAKQEFKSFQRLVTVCSGAAVSIALPACSAFSSAAPPPTIPSGARPALQAPALPGTCNGKLVVLSDQQNSVVNFYKQAGKNQPPCFQLTSANGIIGLVSGAPTRTRTTTVKPPRDRQPLRKVSFRSTNLEAPDASKRLC